jgi:hypothetical protein
MLTEQTFAAQEFIPPAMLDDEPAWRFVIERMKARLDVLMLEGEYRSEGVFSTQVEFGRFVETKDGLTITVPAQREDAGFAVVRMSVRGKRDA